MRLFPAQWRAQNEDELIGTLLDRAGPGCDTIPYADAADLVRSAMVLRFRALAACFNGSVALALVPILAGLLAVRLWVSEVPVEFLVTSLVVVVIPGTGVVYTVSSSIAGGWRRGLFAAIGCTFGIVPHLGAAMLGLSGVMQAGATAFEAVRWAGVAYLVLMGMSMIRNGGSLRLDDGGSGRPPTDSMSAVVRRGILVNLLNPKLTVFFFAFLPQFLDHRPDLLDTRLVGLSAIFMLMTLAVFAAYAKASAAVRDQVLGAPTVLRWVQRSLGVLLIGFAARLATSDR
jgi:threonine/homoserine/homoserine lactone efflux protein